MNYTSSQKDVYSQCSIDILVPASAWIKLMRMEVCTWDGLSYMEDCCSSRKILRHRRVAGDLSESTDGEIERRSSNWWSEVSQSSFSWDKNMAIRSTQVFRAWRSLEVYGLSMAFTQLLSDSEEICQSAPCMAKTLQSINIHYQGSGIYLFRCYITSHVELSVSAILIDVRCSSWDVIAGMLVYGGKYIN